MRGDCGGILVANLGDSGFIHVRKGSVVFETVAQQHSFNFPYQIGAPATGAGSVSPHDAQVFDLKEICEGDVFVLGTDGLFDNASANEIACMVRETEEKHKNQRNYTKLAKSIATVVAETACAWSKDKARQSPFAMEAAKAGLLHQGGKQDDI